MSKYKKGDLIINTDSEIVYKIIKVTDDLYRLEIVKGSGFRGGGFLSDISIIDNHRATELYDPEKDYGYMYEEKVPY